MELDSDHSFISKVTIKNPLRTKKMSTPRNPPRRMLHWKLNPHTTTTQERAARDGFHFDSSMTAGSTTPTVLDLTVHPVLSP